VRGGVHSDQAEVLSRSTDRTGENARSKGRANYSYVLQQATALQPQYGVKMDLRGDQFKRTASAPAELNLFLEVLGRREDGFHDLETLMVPVRLADQVSFTPSPPAATGRPGEIRFDIQTCWPVRARSRQEVPANGNNLIVRALELFRERS